MGCLPDPVGARTHPRDLAGAWATALWNARALDQESTGAQLIGVPTATESLVGAVQTGGLLALLTGLLLMVSAAPAGQVRAPRVTGADRRATTEPVG